MAARATAGQSTNWAAPRLQGKTFALAGIPPHPRRMMATLIKDEGGTVLPDVTAKLNYLVVGQATSGPTPAEQKAQRLIGTRGAAIQILTEEQFAKLFLPSRAEALAMLTAGNEGLRRWNRLCGDYWVKGTVDLRDIDLRGAHLVWVKFHAALLDGSDLRGSDLTQAIFGNIEKVTFDGSVMRGARLWNVTDCSLKEVDLSEGGAIEMTRTVLDGARLVQAKVHRFYDCSLKGVDLSEAHTHPAKFERCDLTGSKLFKVDALTSEFVDSSFRGADLRRAILANSRFRRVDLSEADLSGADLTRCDLSAAPLTGARLGKADLTDAKLTRADLSHADLRESNLAGASLTGAVIEGADFTGANLRGTILRGLDRTKAKGLEAVRPAIKAGPHIRRLEEVVKQTRYFESRATLDYPDGPVELRFSVSSDSNLVPTVAVAAGKTRHDVANSLREALLGLTQTWGQGTLRFDSVTARSGSSPVAGQELKELALAAWCEGLGVAVPSTTARREQRAARKSAEHQLRERLLADLHGGPEGVRRWNERRHAERKKAGGFRGVDLSGTRLEGANLGWLDFEGANFRGATLIGAQLRWGTFNGADFEGAELKEARLDNGSFRRACFRGARLGAAAGPSAQFQSANFEGTWLMGGYFWAANFRGANLKGADLRGAVLRFGNLCSSDLSTANLEDAEFEDTQYNEQTRLPKGFRPPPGLKWVGTGPAPGTRRPRGADKPPVPIDFDTFMKRLAKHAESARLTKALEMLKAERFRLFAQVDEAAVVGVVKSQRDPDLVYSCRLGADGSFACCTQNLRVCGGLRGQPCKHLLLLLIGLAKGGELEPALADRWLRATRGCRPILDRDAMSTTLLRYKSAESGEVDWRPTETVPEDYYAW